MAIAQRYVLTNASRAKNRYVGLEWRHDPMFLPTAKGALYTSIVVFISLNLSRNCLLLTDVAAVAKKQLHLKHINLVQDSKSFAKRM